MRISKTRNAIRNICSGIIYKVFSLVMPFVVRTVFIRTLSMEYLGLDSLFTSILQVLNLSELGISSAIVYCMYKPIADENISQLNALYNYIKKAYRIIGIATLAIGLSVLPFLNHFVNGEVPADINIYILYFIYLFNTVLSYSLFAYKNALLNAFQRVDASNWILTISKLFLYVVQLIVLFVIPNYYIYVLIIPISTLINNIITAVAVKRMFPYLNPDGTINGDTKREIKHQIAGVFVSKLCIASRNSFDSIIISAFIGLSATAIYNNYYYILSALVSVMAIFTNAITGGVGNSIAVFDENKNYNDFRKFNFIYMWIGGLFAICLFVLYQPFMKLWIGEKGILELPSVIMFSCYFFCLIMGDIRATYTVAAGLWWENRYRSVLEAILNLILNIVLGKIWGLNGVLAATIITVILINFIASSQILFKFYFKNQRVRSFLIITIYYFLVTVFGAALSYVVVHKVHISGIVGLVVGGFISMLIGNILYLLMYHNLYEYKESMQWLKGVLLRRRNKV